MYWHDNHGLQPPQLLVTLNSCTNTPILLYQSRSSAVIPVSLFSSKGSAPIWHSVALVVFRSATWSNVSLSHCRTGWGNCRLNIMYNSLDMSTERVIRVAGFENQSLPFSACSVDFLDVVDVDAMARLCTLWFRNCECGSKSRRAKFCWCLRVRNCLPVSSTVRWSHPKHGMA